MSSNLICGFSKECCGLRCCDYEVFADAGRLRVCVRRDTFTERGRAAVVGTER